MLAVQVQYYAAKENKRHNIVVEKETGRHNRVEEDLGYRNLNENIRHNRATEDYWNASLDETRRHNTATEQIDYYNAQTNRYNAESNRMNVGVNAMNAQTNAVNAQTSRLHMLNDYQLGLEANELQERNIAATERRNQIQEQQNQYSQNIGRFDTAQQYSNILNNQRKADIDEMNARIREGTLNLQGEEFKHQKREDAVRDVDRFANTMIHGVDVGNRVAQGYINPLNESKGGK